MDKKGIAACALGPELRAAVHEIAESALPYAELISPIGATGDYATSWELVDEIVTDIGDPPMARVAAQLANTSDHAILVEVGTPTADPHRVLSKVLDWIEGVARSGWTP